MVAGALRRHTLFRGLGSRVAAAWLTTGPNLNAQLLRTSSMAGLCRPTEAIHRSTAGMCAHEYCDARPWSQAKRYPHWDSAVRVDLLDGPAQLRSLLAGPTVAPRSTRRIRASQGHVSPLRPARHWSTYGDNYPLPNGADALEEPFTAFPSWFLQVTCDRCGKK